MDVSTLPVNNTGNFNRGSSVGTADTCGDSHVDSEGGSGNDSVASGVVLSSIDDDSVGDRIAQSSQSRRGSVAKGAKCGIGGEAVIDVHAVLAQSARIRQVRL